MDNRKPLWAHQIKAIERFKDQKSIGLLFEMGAGKSRTIIEILEYRYSQGHGILPTLIVCPLSVVENWRREIQEYSHIEARFVLPLTRSGKEKCKTLAARPSDNVIVITNFESLLSPDLFNHLHAWLRPWPIGFMVIDESQRVKSPSAKRTKNVLKLGGLIENHAILTGTPILNSPLDIFTQFKFLDGGSTFVDFTGKPLNYYSFRATYMYDKNAGMPKQRYFPNWQIKPGALEALNEKIYSKAMRVEKKDCLDLPPFIQQTMYAELSGEATRLYKEMKQHFITYLGDKACVASLVIVKALRLLQITNGVLGLEESEEELECGKISILRELLEDLTPNHKVIVWAVFRMNYKMIADVCQELSIPYVYLHGDIDQAGKVVSMDKFQTDDSVRVLIGNPASGGIGVNLTAASYSIYFSRNFSLENDLQSEARNFRAGSEIHEKVTRIDLVTKDTIDELVLSALADKQKISDTMLKNWAKGVM